MTEKLDPCPNLAQHTPSPDNYATWHEWAEAMEEAGAVSEECPGCHHWSIWTAPLRPLPEHLRMDSGG